jgi:hypothetical protein
MASQYTKITINAAAMTRITIEVMHMLMYKSEFGSTLLDLLKPSDIHSFMLAFGVSLSEIDMKKYMCIWRELFVNMRWISLLKSRGMKPLLVSRDLPLIIRGIRNPEMRHTDNRLHVELLVYTPADVFKDTLAYTCHLMPDYVEALASMEAEALVESLRYNNRCTLPCSVMEQSEYSTKFAMARYGDRSIAVDGITTLIRPVFTHRLEKNGSFIAEQVVTHDLVTSCWLESRVESRVTSTYESPYADPFDEAHMNGYVINGMTSSKPKSYSAVQISKGDGWSGWSMYVSEINMVWAADEEILMRTLPTRVIDNAVYGRDENIEIRDGHLVLP